MPGHGQVLMIMELACQAGAVTSPVKATVDLAALRRTYLLHGLTETDLTPDPIAQFHHWLADQWQAKDDEIDALMSRRDG